MEHLKNEPDPGGAKARARASGECIDIVADKAHASMGWPQHPAERQQQGRLSAATGSKHTDKISTFDFQVQTVEAADLSLGGPIGFA
jgi:hypothetical protein